MYTLAAAGDKPLIIQQTMTNTQKKDKTKILKTTIQNK